MLTGFHQYFDDFSGPTVGFPLMTISGPTFGKLGSKSASKQKSKLYFWTQMKNSCGILHLRLGFQGCTSDSQFLGNSSFEMRCFYFPHISTTCLIAFSQSHSPQMQNSQGIVNLRYTLGPPTSNEEFHRNSSFEFKNKVHLCSKIKSELYFC